jgi:hypothetical protein
MASEKELEAILDDPNAHQLKAFHHAKECACTDAMKSTKSKNPHNKGSLIAELWDYVYEEYYEIQSM